jgi:hypothetical protein
MDVGTTFVPYKQSAKPMKPGKGSFRNPAVSAEALGGFDSTPGDARNDAPPPARLTATPVVICFVGVQFPRPTAWRTPRAADPRNSFEHLLERNRIIDVGRGQPDGERYPVPVDDRVVLASRFASIRRVRAGFFAPLFAGTMEASSAARDQSIRPCSPNSSSRTRCRRSHTPAACQSRSLRQQVIPDPQPISRGSIFHGMPLRRTNKIPPSAARSGTGGRPPSALDLCGGSSGSMRCQRESGTSGFAIGWMSIVQLASHGNTKTSVPIPNGCDKVGYGTHGPPRFC